MAKRTNKDKKAALLTAAKELFSTQGYQNTTVQAITAAAGVATGSFYSYFSSKEACFFALTELLYERLLQKVLDARRGARAGLDKLRRSLAAAVDVFLDDPPLARAILGQSRAREPLIGARIEEVRESLITFLIEDLEEADPVPPAPVLLAHMLFGALAEAMQARLEDNLPEKEQEGFRQYLLTYLDRLLFSGQEEPPPSMRPR